jgi:hypothetical protein
MFWRTEPSRAGYRRAAPFGQARGSHGVERPALSIDSLAGTRPRTLMISAKVGLGAQID